MQVSFIIPIYNQLAFTRACLDSLTATLPGGLTHEIILVDDGSTDGSRDFLRELPPPFQILLNDRNLGYAAANNRGARVAQGEFLVLLNNDLVLPSGWLEPILAAFTRFPRVGIVGNIQLDAATGEVDHVGVVFRDGGYPVHLRESLAVVQSRGSYAAFPGGVTAACCAVRREWFVRVGGFDEAYRNGFEDNDLCLRSREDGFTNLTSTASVVRHHISRSPGRAAHEYRNAERFLARWGPRCAALEKEFALTEGREHAASVARKYLSSPLHRLGFGLAAVRRQHKAAVARWHRAAAAANRPLRIGIDLLRLAPGGANGGVKPLVYSFLAEIGRQRGRSFNFAVIAEKPLRDELGSILRAGDFFLELSCQHLLVSQRDAQLGYREAGRFAIADNIGKRAQLDVLYCPFGVSQFMRPELPSVSLIVDLLHRDLPAALPREEVNYREQWFARVVREATFIQGISHDVISRLSQHYGVQPSRCFHTYIPAQNRLPSPASTAVAPADVPAGPFFFYPANFWPHKNHETLFVAYRLYLQGAGTRAWPLVLTGASDERMTLLREMCAGLKISDQVFFLGHLNDPAFSVVWARAGALVFPSLNEGFGIPLLEAMRFGVPIIAAQATALPEVGGDACVYVDPADPRAIADVLRRVAIREAFRDDLVARGRKRLGAFSLELEAGRLAHFLEAAARRQTP